MAPATSMWRSSGFRATGNDRVQKVSSGVATTFAGNGMASPGTNALLTKPEGVFASSSDVYVSDTGQHRVVKYALAGGDGTVVAGGNGVGGALDQLSSPSGLFVDENAEELGVPIINVYVVDTDNHRVMRVRDDTQAATLVAGGCLENPDYIVPCIQGGLHDPLRPWPDNDAELNPSSDNPPVYHFFGPSGLHVYLGTTVNITVADTLNHRVLMWFS
ncbi:unnamed protein product [Durusdinium trenchii]|uniref:Uncharacterized protein n=1 Tax=Durusdinium trenchii TaxID=1381693 RepID=A0ABP0ITY4_9DINO